MTHRLQVEFATPQGEQAYVDMLRAHVASGNLDAADEILMADLASLDRDLAQQCTALSPDRVTIDGWAEMIDTIADMQGEPASGIAIGMANEPDLAFEKGELHTPYLTLGIYTDESYAWSSASREDILAQCASGEPQWSGMEEDVEIYMDIEGLDAINTALIHHKQRFFLRDGNPEIAPEGYVEYVLASWLRALRFHQAVAAQVAEHGLPGGVTVVSGTVEMMPELVAVHDREQPAATAAQIVETGSLIESAAPKFGMLPEVAEPAVNIRQRVAAAAANDAGPEQAEGQQQGYFTRVFGRLGVGLKG